MTTFPDEYMFAAGHNNANSMVVIPQQPTSPSGMIDFAQIEDATNSAMVQNFPTDKLLYTPSLPTSKFNTLNSFFGFDPLSGVSSVEGTFRLRTDDNTFSNFNGTIKYPRGRKRGMARWESTEYDIVDLVEL